MGSFCTGRVFKQPMPKFKRHCDGDIIDVLGDKWVLVKPRQLTQPSVTSTPMFAIHAPASCGRGLEGDGQTILQLTRRRRRRHANSWEIVSSDFPWHIHTEKCLLTTRHYYTRAFAIVSSPQLSRV